MRWPRARYTWRTARARSPWSAAGCRPPSRCAARRPARRRAPSRARAAGAAPARASWRLSLCSAAPAAVSPRCHAAAQGLGTLAPARRPPETPPPEPLARRRPAARQPPGHRRQGMQPWAVPRRSGRRWTRGPTLPHSLLAQERPPSQRQALQRQPRAAATRAGRRLPHAAHASWALRTILLAAQRWGQRGRFSMLLSGRPARRMGAPAEATGTAAS